MIRHLFLLVFGLVGGFFAKGFIEEKMLSEDDKLHRILRKHGKEREVRMKELKERWKDKFAKADYLTAEALDLFKVPENSLLRKGDYFNRLFQGEIINYFRSSSRHYGVADRIGHIVFVLKNSDIPWGDGSPEGEWARHVVKEIWWPLLKSLAREPDDKIKGLEQEIAILERTLEVLS